MIANQTDQEFASIADAWVAFEQSVSLDAAQDDQALAEAEWGTYYDDERWEFENSFEWNDEDFDEFGPLPRRSRVRRIY